MDQPELNTKRLLLRAFLLEDVHVVNILAGNINVSKTTLNIPHPYSSEMAQSWIETHNSGWEQKTNVVYAITLSENGQLIGAVGLHDVKPPEAELGYWIGEPYWGNGYCTEAVKELIQFSFKTLGINKIKSEHLTSNPASGKVMIKAGMRHRKIIKNNDRHGQLADIEVYEITST